MKHVLLSLLLCAVPLETLGAPADLYATVEKNTCDQETRDVEIELKRAKSYTVSALRDNKKLECKTIAYRGENQTFEQCLPNVFVSEYPGVKNLYIITQCTAIDF